MAEKSASPDRITAAIARKQHGVASIWQLRSAGLSDDAVLGRVRAGRLHRLYQGVYAVGHSAPSPEARWVAAVLACGGPSGAGGDRGNERGKVDGTTMQVDASSTKTILGYWGAALSYRSAACHWGLLKPVQGTVDVSIPGDGGRRRRKGIRLHRCSSLLPADVTLHRGIPVTSPARTISDLRRAAAGSGRDRIVSPKELRRAIRQADVLGLPIGSGDDRDRTRSDLERDFLGLCRHHRLPAPEVNVRIDSHLVDFLWRDRKLVVESDGYIYHRGRAAFEDDRARDLALRGLGYEVVRLADRQITDEPAQIAEILRARLGSFPSDGPETRHAAP